MKLPLSLLEAITNNFSDERVLGRGGFAVVYKGMLGNKPVATIDVDEEKFKKEMHCLMNLRHKNVVRFLGYCDETQQKSVEYDGKPVIADQRNRLLCFEFVPKCLQEHITAASCGLEWRIRYQIIKGICDALHYLHEKRIVHADLKPANILLDDNMLPKIADFGLSRCFDEDQSKAITSKLIGSIGYLPQEFFDGHITLKLDIYSLGVIINEMLTGNKATSAEENARDIRARHTVAARVCAEMAKMCIDPNKENRPSTHRIIEMLEVGSADKFDEAGTSTSLVAQNHVILALYKNIFFTDFVAFSRSYGIRVCLAKSLLDELKLLAKLEHRNVVRLIGFCNVDGWFRFGNRGLYICNEYFSRGSLDRHIFGSANNQRTPLRWSIRYEIIRGICAGLQYLHEVCNNTIPHMRLKPSNILLDEHMVPKIADFCLSKAFANMRTHTYTRTAMGSTGYKAPEFLERGRGISHKCDIYSLGIIIMAIVMGEEPRGFCDPSGLVFIWKDVEKCILLALECVEVDPEKRPLAREILYRLPVANASASHVG
ncbi:hypothetical protein PVAP13_9KG529060 [Panicum virgatum]|uniref:non-specific serine/threonine protein kinase n=1 Tax=Panicum virgatum TaxID=38727 RepID=A0A8T0ND51_PANVG|nr:hypothetical protein PVAP13_9KG067314 [Panicum virgatum]KAG2547042.1 hypothetical protein PVAP13_9KG529060 [Panicum virgatum]